MTVAGPAQDASAGRQHAPITDPFWPAGLTFERVLDRARLREAEALSLLYRRFLPVVYRFLLARVSDVPVAEDLTSDTFFAIIEGIGGVRAQDELGFATWALGIARNKLAQHFRRLKSRREIPLTFPEAAEPPTTAEADDPLSVIAARESWDEVVDALNQLTPEQRMVLLHRCILGEPTEAVAQIMGKPPNAIYGLQFRALAALARRLKGGDQSTSRRPDAAKHDEGRSSERRRGHVARREP
jgi:RNA polymerase sigma-70 factor (ECF subfamily)